MRIAKFRKIALQAFKQGSHKPHVDSAFRRMLYAIFSEIINAVLLFYTIEKLIFNSLKESAPL